MFGSGLLFLIIIGVIIALLFKAKPTPKRSKGQIGEERVQRLLSQLGAEYELFNDLYVPKSNGELTQIDHVLLSLYGIFVIETKNYDGWIFGQEHEKNWTQAIYQKKSRFYNPIMQNHTHMKALKQAVAIDVPMYSIIVFSDEVTLKFKEPFKKAHVIQNRVLLQTIQQYRAVQMSEEQLLAISAMLRSFIPTTNAKKREIERQHLQHVQQVKSGKVRREPIATRSMKSRTQATQVPSKHTCPRCGSELVLRNGKHGPFYGCQQFPKCRFTLQEENITN